MVLMAVLLLTLMMSTLGAALSLITSSEALIAANVRDAQETRVAAAAAAERTVAEAAALPDWNLLLDGTVRSAFFDSGASRITLADGKTLDVEALLNLANCGHEAACSAAETAAITADRPWGANNAQWRLFSRGWLRDVQPGAALDSACFTLVLVGDDPAETDNNPLRDAAAPGPGAGIIRFRAYAFGWRGTRRTIEVAVARLRDGSTRAISWRDGP